MRLCEKKHGMAEDQRDIGLPLIEKDPDSWFSGVGEKMRLKEKKIILTAWLLRNRKPRFAEDRDTTHKLAEQGPANVRTQVRNQVPPKSRRTWTQNSGSKTRLKLGFTHLLPVFEIRGGDLIIIPPTRFLFLCFYANK